MKIYTKTGDDGTTGLFHGGRVDKASVLPMAYGAVDEAQAAIGFARAAVSDPELNELLTTCLLYTSPSPRDLSTSRMPSSA